MRSDRYTAVPLAGRVAGDSGPYPVASSIAPLGPTPVEVSEVDLASGDALARIIEEYRVHHPRADGAVLDTDARTLERAFASASTAHADQRRKSGEPYFVHPVKVATTLAQLGLDVTSIVAGLLHDAVEDSELTVFDVHENFGREVASIVDGVTKLGKVPYLSRQEQQAESFRKMLLAMSEDIRVLLVKLIDRLDNMRTLGHMPAEKQHRISTETMQIYAPLAGRLGIEWVRRELQDLSFSYLEPIAYENIRSEVQAYLSQNVGVVEDGIARLQEVFAADREVDASDDDPLEAAAPWQPSLFGDVMVRATLRPMFRLQRRMTGGGRKPSMLSDVATFQVVTRDRASCYAALGQLHAVLQPVPGRFRDYIALPRPNRYQALHTSVIDRDGGRLEVQVRSEGMDGVAERGIVAQWGDGPTDGRRLAWLGQLMDWQKEVDDPHEFIEAVKADLYADEVYVFSPKGDIFTFPKGASPIDFAFAIHTDVGMGCSGARVNGHLVPLRYRLRQGDTVEILTNPAVAPREEWLKMCVSSRARARIKQHLRGRERERLRSLGRSLVEQEVASRGGTVETLDDAKTLGGYAEGLGLSPEVGADGVLEAVGAGQVAATTVADRICNVGREGEGLLGRVIRRVRGPSLPRQPEGGRGSEPSMPIVLTRELVDGSEALVQLAPCCSPVPGDPLLGFFEPGRGVTAHVQGCPDALEQLSARRVHLAWSDEIELSCPVTVEVRTGNTVGLLAEMSRVFSHHEVNIKQANCRAYGDGERAINTFHASVGSLKQLQSLLTSLRSTEGVLAVQRVFNPGSTPYPRA
ncbi:MAG: HD domain-containing protein [Myxococcota bacterium]